MSKPRIATVADAIITQMQAATWSQAFEIERVYMDRAESSELKTLRVQLMCGASDPSTMTRKHRRWTHTIQIAVRKNVDPANVASIDALAAFAEDIAEYWSSGSSDGKRVVTNTAATVAGVSFLPYSPDVLDTARCFISVITLTVIEVVAV